MKNRVLLFSFFLILIISCSQKLSDKGEKMTPKAPEKFTEKTEVYTYNKMNPADQEFPGGRGTNEMIIYTPEFGKSTGTNEYGTEAVISKGVVIKYGENNSEIPPDGFVVSGHDKAKDWILKNLKPGIYVELNKDKNEIKSICKLDSLKFFYNSLMKDINENLAYLKQKGNLPSAQFEPEKKAAEDLFTSGTSLEKSENKIEARKNFTDAIERLKNAYAMTMPAFGNKSLRGVWYRIVEKNPAELEKTVQKLAESGFNAIFPETIYYGTSICPPPSTLLEQNAYYAGWDPLKSLIEIAHKHNMEVHAWVHVFFIGFKDNPNEIPHTSHLIAKYPDWLAVNKDGEYESTLEKGYYFFSPSNSYVRNGLSITFQELVRRYDLDGFQFDYIRYSMSEPINKGYCYSSASREKFYKQYDKDPAMITPMTNPDLWEKWNKFRENEITSFVGEVAPKLKEIKPNIKLSAAVFADKKEAIKMKFQNWPLWCDRKYVDFICPMAYYQDIGKISKVTAEIKYSVKDNAGACMGLLVTEETSPLHLLLQMRSAQERGADGVVFFSLNSINDDFLNLLKNGPFRKQP